MSNDMLRVDTRTARIHPRAVTEPVRGPDGTTWQPPGSVDRCLGDFLATEILALGDIDPALVPFASIARDLAMAGGKRLRPAFAYWGWRGAAGPGADPGTVVPPIASLELLHTFALIHDDVMDRGDTRRGRPTAHRAYAATHASGVWHGDPEQFGTAAAILAGDLCLVWADRLIAEATLPPERLAAARTVYDLMRVEAMAGQYLDMLGEATPGQWSTGRALRVARYKSASYTVVRPLEFGAALATGSRVPAARHSLHSGQLDHHDGNRLVAAARQGPDGPPGDPDHRAKRPGLTQEHTARPVASDLVHAYRRYGTPVGEAFQLRDDILGLYGDPAATGKPTGDDLRRGKPTALVTIARSRAGVAQREVIDRCLRAGAGTDAVEELGAVIMATGARDEVERMIADRIRTAVGFLDDAPVDAPVRDALAELAAAVAYRET